jgi:hypothetical protein
VRGQPFGYLQAQQGGGVCGRCAVPFAAWFFRNLFGELYVELC